MNLSALGVSFRQALRSVILVFFPLSFISLFAWATAGSVTANSDDPMRASVWLWLGSHQIPFTVTTGKLTVLPLLAALFPFLALRSSFPKVEASFSRIHGARLFYSLWYSLFTFLMALVSTTHQVKANLWAAPLSGFVIALLSTVKINRKKFQHFYFALYGFCILTGIGTLIFAFSLVTHWQVLKNIETVIAPGFVGGLLFVLLQLLYLPNIALITVSYITGIGFSFGSHTAISANHFSLHQIPAIPILSALPTGRHPIVRYGIVIFVIFALLYFWQVRRSHLRFVERGRHGIVDAFYFFLLVGLLTYLSSGELLTPALDPIGIDWPRFMSYLGIVFFLCALVVIYLPEMMKKLQRLVHHE
jgi:hypothetical protein